MSLKSSIRLLMLHLTRSCIYSPFDASLLSKDALREFGKNNIYIRRALNAIQGTEQYVDDPARILNTLAGDMYMLNGTACYAPQTALPTFLTSWNGKYKAEQRTALYVLDDTGIDLCALYASIRGWHSNKRFGPIGECRNIGTARIEINDNIARHVSSVEAKSIFQKAIEFDVKASDYKKRIDEIKKDLILSAPALQTLREGDAELTPWLTQTYANDEGIPLQRLTYRNGNHYAIKLTIPKELQKWVTDWYNYVPQALQYAEQHKSVFDAISRMRLVNSTSIGKLYVPTWYLDGKLFHFYMNDKGVDEYLTSSRDALEQKKPVQTTLFGKPMIVATIENHTDLLVAASLENYGYKVITSDLKNPIQQAAKAGFLFPATTGWKQLPYDATLDGLRLDSDLVVAWILATAPSDESAMSLISELDSSDILVDSYE